jgi:hypothetical protein
VHKIKAKTVTKIKADSKQALIEAKDYYFGLKSIDWENDNSDDIEFVRTYMNKRGFTNRILNRCRAKVNYSQSYPIIFPIVDNGNFRGWLCRTPFKAIEKKRKYLYNEGFSRRNTICGTYKSKIFVVVEGYMDMLKFKQFGIKNVGAILGWKITAQQIAKLKEAGVELIISALDNDKCGKRGTIYLKQFFDVIPFQYPDGIKDAGEMDQKTFDRAFKNTKRKLGGK